MPTVFAEDHEVEISQELADLGDEWTKLALNRCGPPEIPVTIFNRRNIGIAPIYKGGLNTAYPYCVDGRLALAVMLEDTDSIDEGIVAHELLHWIVMLHGFRSYINQTHREDNCEVMLNGLLSHVPVNREAEKRGFPLTHLFDSNARSQARFLTSDEQTALSEEAPLRIALYCSDLLLNCSVAGRTVLEQSIDERPQIATLVKQILSITKHRDLLEPNKNSRAGRRIIKALHLTRRGDYHLLNNTGQLRAVLRANPCQGKGDSPSSSID